LASARVKGFGGRSPRGARALAWEANEYATSRKRRRPAGCAKTSTPNGLHRLSPRLGRPVPCTWSKASMCERAINVSTGPGIIVLGRVCKLCSNPYTARHAQRRDHQRPVGAAAVTASAANTKDWPAIRGPSPHSERHCMDSAHRSPLARFPRTLWLLAHGRQSLLPLAAGWALGAALRGCASPSGRRWLAKLGRS